MAIRGAQLDERQSFDALDMMGRDMNDAQIARVFGVSRQVIGRLRRKHGIAACGKRYLFRPPEAQIAELHTASNKEMERRHGIGADTWGKVRLRYGVPRFRPPTVINGKPNKWAEKVEKVKQTFLPGANFMPAPIPPRDTSLAGEAAAFLQRERFTVFNRAKIGAGEGWQVGHSVYDAPGLIAKASRLGFKQEEWMA